MRRDIAVNQSGAHAALMTSWLRSPIAIATFSTMPTLYASG